MPGEEFITLHEARPQRPPYNPAVNQPAVPATTPGYQGQVGQQPPRAVNVSGQQYHPQSPIRQQYYPGLVTASTPQWRQPQYAPVQPDAKVEISDLHKDRPLTEEEARKKKREEFSQYSIIRIVRDEGSRASDGTKRKPSWARVQFIPDPSITKKEATRAVRKLDQTTPSATEKKRDLTEDQRRQVERAFSLQQKWDDETFYTALVQLEDEVEQKPKESEREGGTERERRKDRHRKEDVGRFGAASKLHSKSNQPKKVATERVSITAYFKRAPRPEIDPFSIPQSLNAQHSVHIADMQQAYSPVATQPVNVYYPPPPQQNIPPPQQHIPPPQSNNPPPQPAPRPTDSRGPNPAHSAQAYAHGPRTTPAQPVPRRPPNAAARRASSRQRSPYRRRPSPPIRDDAHSPLSTDESAYSKVFSDADDDTDYTDPSTPSYVSNRDFFDRPRRNSRYMESPAHYGIQPKFGRGKPQGEVHIQPHRSHERRPELGARQQTVPILNQQPLPRHMSDPAPGQGFPQPRPGNANMASAGPPSAPSQSPPVQVPTGPRPAGPAQFPAPPPGAQSQGRPPGQAHPGPNPAAFPSQPNPTVPTPTPGQHNPEPMPRQQWQGFSGGPGSHPPPNMTPRGPGPMNVMNGMDPRTQANPMNPNHPGNQAGNLVNGSNPAMNQRPPGNQGNPGNPGNPGNSEGNPSQNPPQNPNVLYAKAYAKGRADTHEEALHMAERVAERVVAAAVPLKAEGRRRGASPVVIQQDRGRGRSGRDRDHGRDSDDYDDSEVEQPRSRFVSRPRSRSRSLDRGRHDQNRHREESRSLDKRRDREGERGRKHDQRQYRYHGHGRERSRSLDRERRRDNARSKTRSLDRQRGRTRSRSRSLDRQRGGRGRTRSRSLPWGGDRQRGGRGRTRSRSMDRGGARHRHRSGDRYRHNERDWDSDRQKGRRRERGREDRSRSRSRSLDRVYRGPHSGFRIVRPSNGYAGPRDGMVRKGLGRDMDRLRLDERDDLGLQDEVFYGQGRNVPAYGAPTRAWVRGVVDRDGDRERDIRAELLRRDEERLKRDEEERVRDDFIRRRDSGIDIGPPFGDSNPFVPQPGFGKRTGAGTGMHVRLDDY